MRKCASVVRSPWYWRIIFSTATERTTGLPKDAATPSMVTSSWVGPTPPLVKTRSCEARRSLKSLLMVLISSGHTSTRRSSIARSNNARARSVVFVSAILPDRISFPMISAAAVRDISLLP